MSSFTVLLLCIQACLIQNVFSACSSKAGLISVAPAATISPSACGAGLSSAAPFSYSPSFIAFGPSAAAFSPASAIGSAVYGGAGEGNVAVIGELPIAGETALSGQVPISGVLGFCGAVPAAGGVSINGNCACGCSSIC